MPLKDEPKKYSFMIRSIIFLLSLSIITSCAVIRPGEVGVVSKFGKLKEPKYQGVIMINPFTSRVIKMPTRTVNREILIKLPSKEGLTINSEISILYRINPEKIEAIITQIGDDFDPIITAVFRSAAADITSQYFAKDMHSGERLSIEERISGRMNELLNHKGFIVESVLLKSISLPAGLNNSIELKLQAEQDMQRMEFTKQKEQLEAERKSIEAEGNKKADVINAEANKRVTEIKAEGDAQATLIRATAEAEAFEKLNEKLTPAVLENLRIEAFRALADSKNGKIIITDGKTPFLSMPEP